IEIREQDGRLTAEWRSSDSNTCLVEFSLDSNAPLFRSLQVDGHVLATQVRPVFILTTGARVQRPGVKYIFFDKPATGKNGPVRQFTAALNTKTVRVKSDGQRATISFDGLAAGPFSGELNFHLYDGSPFLQV